MPIINTTGALSTKGFGLTLGGLVLYTQTFTSSTTWTCPSTCASLLTLVGKGENGVSDINYSPYTNNANLGFYSAGTGVGTSGQYTWSQLYTDTTNVKNLFVSNQYGPSSANFVQVTNYGGNNVYNKYIIPQNYSSLYITGTSAITASGAAPAGGGGNITAYGQYTFYISATVPGRVGNNSTAFGYTFAGGTLSGAFPNRTGNTAATSTYNNVAVTPGTGYSIVVNGGSVTISYYA